MADTPYNRLAQVQAAFLTILPLIERHGRVSFRHLRRDPDRLEEALAEMVALCWKWFLGLVQRGKDPTQFPTTLAVFAAKAVKAGRKLCGKGKAQDAMSPLAQQRHSFLVQSLPRFDTSDQDNPALEALQDNTVTPPPEQAVFRIDFPAWVRRYPRRKRTLIRLLMVGERTKDVAQRHRTTPGRISQVRRELCEDWQQFCGQ